MKIYKTMLFFVGEPLGGIEQCDTIEYQGAFWLVPKWLDNPATGLRRPLRIIRLDSFSSQDNRTGGSGFGDFVLPQGMPKEIFDGRVQSLAGKQVVFENPPIDFPMPLVAH